MDKISIVDEGTDLQVTIVESGEVVDISAATDFHIILTAPSGEKHEVVGTKLTDGLDGDIHSFINIKEIANEDGIWSYIGRVRFSPTQVFHSINPKEFEVI